MRRPAKMDQASARTRIARLVARERRLIEELHELAQQEQQCCEADEAEQLPEIVTMRSMVFQALIDAHNQTAELAGLMAEREWAVPVETVSAAEEGAAMVRQIDVLDHQSQSLLQTMMSSRLTALRRVNDGARLLRSFQARTHAVAHDSRS